MAETGSFSLVTTRGAWLHAKWLQVSGPVMVPLPTSPYRLLPQARAVWPCSARLDASPAETTWTPLRKALGGEPGGQDFTLIAHTATGSNADVLTAAFPNCPDV